MLTVTPHLSLSTLGQQRTAEGEGAKGTALPAVAFRGGASATYFQYFGKSNGRDIQPNGFNLGVDVNAALTILPSRPVNFELSADYRRNVQPFTERVGTGQNYANDAIVPSARLNFGSRSGVLNGSLGYQPQVSFYEKAPFDYLNQVTHSVQGAASWKFLPHTALLYDAELGIQQYNNEDSPNATTLVADNRRFITRLGINGAFTERITLRIMAGYGAIVYPKPIMTDYENAVGEAVLGVKIGAAHQFETGYTGTVQTSSIGGWMRTDRGFARMRMLFANAFALILEGGAGYVTYGRVLGFYTPPTGQPNAGVKETVPLGQDGTSDRSDVRVDAAIRGEYRATNWLAFMLDATMLDTITDFTYVQHATTASGAPQVFPDPAKFLDFQVFGGIRAHY